MHVIVLGAGIVGVSTAWYLRKHGIDVTVIDRQPQAATETSYANAGLISPGHVFSWASPKAPRIMLQSLFRDDTAFRLRPQWDLDMWRWCARFLWNCTETRARRNTMKKLRLAIYSQQCLAETVAETGIEFDWGRRGLLYLHHTRESLDHGIEDMKILVAGGIEMEALTPERCIEIEPALAASRGSIAGAVYCPTDASGDCRAFTRALAGKCAEVGVRFLFDTEIRDLRVDGARINAVDTASGEMTADAYVLALGSYSPLLAGKAGVKLPVYPVKGYSLTVPVDGHNGAPMIGGVDEGLMTAWSRLGDRLRVTSTAEIAGYDRSLDEKRFALMRRSIESLFPDCGDLDGAEKWAGLRPMTPDGPPIFGRARHDNLWFNTGQGSLGWTMGPGSGRVAADLIAGRPPAIALDGMELGRR